MKTVTVKQVVLGEGSPKIIVPLMGGAVDEVRDKAQLYRDCLDFDILELRVDYLTEAKNAEQVLLATKVLRETIPEKPILLTLRTAGEGGQADFGLQNYLTLNQVMIDSGLIDLIDLELFTASEDKLKNLIMQANTSGVKVVLSSHDFTKTPPKAELISRLCLMQDHGADVLKVAVMPLIPKDVLELLWASLEMYELYATRPIITISMGRMGMISRFAGGIFGSCATFGAIGPCSAPGQIQASDLHHILNL